MKEDIILQAWLGWSEASLLDDLSADFREKLRLIFFSGAFAAVSFVGELGKPGMSDTDTIVGMGALISEMNAFKNTHMQTMIPIHIPKGTKQ